MEIYKTKNERKTMKKLSGRCEDGFAEAENWRMVLADGKAEWRRFVA